GDQERSGKRGAATPRDDEGNHSRISRLNRFSLARTDGPGGSGPSCGNHGCAGGERCRGRGPGRSRSTQGHWLKYSFAISLRSANQVNYFPVVEKLRTEPKLIVPAQRVRIWRFTYAVNYWHNRCSEHETTTLPTAVPTYRKYDHEKESKLCLNRSCKMSGLVFVFCSRKSRSVF